VNMLDFYNYSSLAAVSATFSWKQNQIWGLGPHLAEGLVDPKVLAKNVI
jgi:hypothetical protein